MVPAECVQFKSSAPKCVQFRSNASNSGLVCAVQTEGALFRPCARKTGRLRPAQAECVQFRVGGERGRGHVHIDRRGHKRKFGAQKPTHTQRLVQSRTIVALSQARRRTVSRGRDRQAAHAAGTTANTQAAARHPELVPLRTFEALDVLTVYGPLFFPIGTTVLSAAVRALRMRRHRRTGR